MSTLSGERKHGLHLTRQGPDKLTIKSRPNLMAMLFYGMLLLFVASLIKGHYQIRITAERLSPEMIVLETARSGWFTEETRMRLNLAEMKRVDFQGHRGKGAYGQVSLVNATNRSQLLYDGNYVTAKGWQRQLDEFRQGKNGETLKLYTDNTGISTLFCAGAVLVVLIMGAFTLGGSGSLERTPGGFKVVRRWGLYRKEEAMATEELRGVKLDGQALTLQGNGYHELRLFVPPPSAGFLRADSDLVARLGVLREEVEAFVQPEPAQSA